MATRGDPPVNPWLAWLGRLAFLTLTGGFVMTAVAPVSLAYFDVLFAFGLFGVGSGLLLLVAWLVTGAITWQIHTTVSEEIAALLQRGDPAGQRPATGAGAPPGRPPVDPGGAEPDRSVDGPGVAAGQQ